MATETQEFQQQIVDRADNPLFVLDVKPPSQIEIKQAVENCLAQRKAPGRPRQ